MTQPDGSPRTLYIIDVYAQLFRAYHAIRNGMRSRVTSEPTHAVFGFTNMLFKLLSNYQPDYLVVAHDAPGRTFRDDLYSDYKGTRSATPDDFTVQIPRTFELLDYMNIPVISVPGMEADDVVATIVRRVLEQPEHSDVHIRIVSKDKDFEQLLGERVALFDVHTDTTIDVPALFANKGIRPDQVVDYLAMLGDAVDNVPGIPGIGPKTASELLQAYDSIDGIYEHLSEIKGKRRENLENARASVPLSRTLVTLESNAEFAFDLEATARHPFQLEPLLALFQQLDFNRLQEEARNLMPSDGTPIAEDSLERSTVAAELLQEPIVPVDRGEYRCITTLDDLKAACNEMRRAPLLSVDTETTGLHADSLLCGISISWRAGSGVYIPVRSPEPQSHLDTETVLTQLRPILEDPALPKAGHNLKFDARVLLRYNVRLRGVRFDSAHAAKLLDPKIDSAKLDSLADSMLGVPMISFQSLFLHNAAVSENGSAGERTFEHVPLDRAAVYAAEDADIVLRLYEIMAPQIAAMQMEALIYELESPLGIVIADMENNGILCDPEELLRQRDALALRVEALRQQIIVSAGGPFDLNSTQQLADVLFNRLKFKAGRKTKTGFSTDEEVLSRLARDEDANRPETALPRLMLEYRELTKLISTYLGSLRDSIQSDGRIHSTFHQLHAATGRLASQGPNLQNIPVRGDSGRQIRAAFRAPVGSVLLCADYSQIELRLLAHLSGDEALLAAFHAGHDIHTAVAAEIFDVPLEIVTREQRNGAKAINFGVIYGITPYGLARRVAGMSVQTATEFIASYNRRFVGIERFRQECIRKALDNDYVETILHRRRAIPELRSHNFNTRNLGERLAVNTVVQGSAADLIKVAMVRVHTRIDRDALSIKPLLQIHDELIFETPATDADAMGAIIREEMEAAMDLKVPLEVSVGIGENWLNAK